MPLNNRSGIVASIQPGIGDGGIDAYKESVIQISLVDSTSQTEGTDTTSIEITKPDSTGDDYLLYVLAIDSNTNITSRPSGWVNIINQSNVSQRLVIDRKIDNGSEPSSYTWEIAAIQKMIGVMASFRNVDVSTPEDVLSVAASGNSDTPTAPDLTPANTGVMLVRACAIDDKTITAVPAGYNSIFAGNTGGSGDVGAGVANLLSDTVGTAEFTADAADTWDSATIALRRK